jgi:hypothetical protein
MDLLKIAKAVSRAGTPPRRNNIITSIPGWCERIWPGKERIMWEEKIYPRKVLPPSPRKIVAFGKFHLSRPSVNPARGYQTIWGEKKVKIIDDTRNTIRQSPFIPSIRLNALVMPVTHISNMSLTERPPSRGHTTRPAAKM